MNRACALLACVSAAAIGALPACRDQPAPAGAEAPAMAEDQPATNRIDIPPAVRQNLGITFATVERRAVARTVRAPGRFELLPRARREYHAPLGGRIELLVEQYEPVDAGQRLYRLDSPAWRQLQREIAGAEGELARAQAEQESSVPLLEAHERHMESLESSVELWSQRVEQLEQIGAAGGGRAGAWAEAQAALTQARSELAGVHEESAQIEARRAQAIAEVSAARLRRDLLLASAATLLGLPVERLSDADGSGVPLWRSTSTLEIRSVAAGVVEAVHVTNGGWVEEGAHALSVVQPKMVRFRARGLQSDLPRLRDGQPARIVPPSGGALGPAEAMRGELAIGLIADADQRTIDLIVTPEEVALWARPGVSGFLEVQTEGSGSAELAIPLDAVIRDGLTPVIFRRDPQNPDEVIRLEADLGIDDGRWIAVKSGVRAGDEVVLDGVYQLMLASPDSASSGGHFHADGTFHPAEDDH